MKKNNLAGQPITLARIVDGHMEKVSGIFRRMENGIAYVNVDGLDYSVKLGTGGKRFLPLSIGVPKMGCQQINLIEKEPASKLKRKPTRSRVPDEFRDLSSDIDKPKGDDEMELPFGFDPTLLRESIKRKRDYFSFAQVDPELIDLDF